MIRRYIGWRNPYATDPGYAWPPSALNSPDGQRLLDALLDFDFERRFVEIRSMDWGRPAVPSHATEGLGVRTKALLLMTICPNVGTKPSHSQSSNALQC